MHDSFETKDEVVVVMELAEGELFQVLEGMDIIMSTFCCGSTLRVEHLAKDSPDRLLNHKM